VGLQVLIPPSIPLSGQVDAVMGVVGGELPVLVGKFLPHVEVGHLGLLRHLPEQVVVNQNLLVIYQGIGVGDVGLGVVEGNQGLYVEDGVGAQLPQGPDELGVGFHKGVVVLDGQLVHPKHHVNLFILFCLHRLPHRELFPHGVEGHFFNFRAQSAGGVEHHQRAVGNEIRPSDTAVNPQPIRPGIPQKNGVGEVVPVHFLRLRRRLGKVIQRRRGGGRRRGRGSRGRRRHRRGRGRRGRRGGYRRRELFPGGPLGKAQPQGGGVHRQEEKDQQKDPSPESGPLSGMIGAVHGLASFFAALKPSGPGRTPPAPPPPKPRRWKGCGRCSP